MRTWVAVLAMLAAVTVAGCGSGGGGVVGQWVIDPGTKADMVKALMAEESMPEDAAKQFIDGLSFDLEFKGDGKWMIKMEMKTPMGDRNGTASGTWKLDGEKLTVITTENDGKPDNETKEFTYSGGKIHMKDKDMPFPLVLVRK